MTSSCSALPTFLSPTSHLHLFPVIRTSSPPYTPSFPSILGRCQNRGYFRPHRIPLLHPSRPPLPRDLPSGLQPQQQGPGLRRPARHCPSLRLVTANDSHRLHDPRRGESLVHAALRGRLVASSRVGGVPSERRRVAGGKEPAGGADGHGGERRRRVGSPLGATGGPSRAEGARVAGERPCGAGAAPVLSRGRRGARGQSAGGGGRSAGDLGDLRGP